MQLNAQDQTATDLAFSRDTVNIIYDCAWIPTIWSVLRGYCCWRRKYDWLFWWCLYWHNLSILWTARVRIQTVGLWLMRVTVMWFIRISQDRTIIFLSSIHNHGMSAMSILYISPKRAAGRRRLQESGTCVGDTLCTKHDYIPPHCFTIQKLG